MLERRSVHRPLGAGGLFLRRRPGAAALELCHLLASAQQRPVLEAGPLPAVGLRSFWAQGDWVLLADWDFRARLHAGGGDRDLVIGESRGLGSGEVRAGAAAMVSVRAYVIDRERERVTATDAAVAYDATASAHGFRAEGTERPAGGTSRFVDNGELFRRRPRCH